MSNAAVFRGILLAYFYRVYYTIARFLDAPQIFRTPMAREAGDHVFWGESGLSINLIDIQ